MVQEQEIEIVRPPGFFSLDNIPWQSLENCLCDKTGSFTLAERFRALFTLRSLGSDEAATIIGKGMIYSINFKEMIY